MMTPEAQAEQQIRQYLLGQLAETEQTHVEERMMTDDEYFELLLVIEDELIDEGASGALSAADQEGFDRYFLSTPERRERVMFAESLREHVAKSVAADAVPMTRSDPVRVLPPRPAWWKLSNPYLRMAAAAIILLAVGLGTWRTFFHPSEVSKGMAALREAYRAQRPTEARITGLDYAPLPPNTRGGGQEKFDYVARDSAEMFMLAAVRKHPDLQAYHDLGRLYLAKHEYDKALDQFAQASKLDEKNAPLENDLAVALLARGQQEDSGKRLETFARALEHLSKALELNGSLLEALFNRALCRQEMKLFQQAEDDWRAYLEKDSNSKWADEARRKLKELEAQKQKASQNKDDLFQNFLNAYKVRNVERVWAAFSQSRSRTGNVITERLLDSYLEQAAQGRNDEADGYLQMVSYAGEVEYQKAGDRFTKALAQFYQTTFPKRRQTLAKARRLMQLASASYNQEEYEETIKLYAKAKRFFAQANDLCEAAVAECWMGIANLRGGATQSLRILEPLSQIFEAKEYKYLLAQSLNGRADAESSQRAFSNTLDLGNRALDISEQIEDLKGMLRNLQFQVAMCQRFGDYRQSLSYIARAFDLASRFSPEPYEIWPFYHQTAFNLYSLQLFAAALDVQQEALRLAVASGLPLLKSRSYARLGLIYDKLGDADAAIKNGEQALAEAQTIKSKKSQDNVIANSALNLAHLYRQRGELSRAVACYDQAIQLHSALSIQIYLFEAHKGKLLALIGLNDDRAAEAEMKTAVEIIEQYRAKISEESNRNGFFDLAQSIYDLAIDFAYARMRDSDRAFHYAESSHARSLLDLMKTDAQVIHVKNQPDVQLPVVTLPLTRAEIQAALPNQAQVLEFAVLDDKILIWVISKDGIASQASLVAASTLNQRVRHYLDLIAKPEQSASQEAASLARELYEWLISPVESWLGEKSYLCIVPDKILGYLPFGALISPRGRYFVEDHCFVFDPSANIFLAATARARRKASLAGESFLGVGNPSFDHSRFADLPTAAREVRDIGRGYAPALILAADSARERRVRSEMPRADVIHLATHYVVDEQSPLLSKLLLARESEPAERPAADGFLQAAEIYDMQLPRTRLVVLSACQTGIERAYQGEGAISIARPFMKAGVPLVVASLWPVETAATSDLMIRFHNHRHQPGVSTAEALRRAQRDMLQSADERDHHPYYWASFAALGGDAQF